MEMVEHQTSYLNERDVLSLLFRVRYANTAAVSPAIHSTPNKVLTNAFQILEATSTIRDALIARLEPVYGLQTVHASLKDFLVEPIPNTLLAANVQLGSHAFGIIGLGKFIMRLPAEILEDELPRLKGSLTSVSLCFLSEFVIKFWKG
jgi:CLIP-associating protein 1/2